MSANHSPNQVFARMPALGEEVQTPEGPSVHVNTWLWLSLFEKSGYTAKRSYIFVKGMKDGVFRHSLERKRCSKSICLGAVFDSSRMENTCSSSTFKVPPVRWKKCFSLLSFNAKRLIETKAELLKGFWCRFKSACLHLLLHFYVSYLDVLIF